MMRQASRNHGPERCDTRNPGAAVRGAAPSTFKADAILLLTAMIWGSGFIAQRLGMDFVGPLLFTALRFALGALILLPIAFAQARSMGTHELPRAALLAGCTLFVAAACQQIGLLHTSIANAGFITGLYVIIVPLLSLALGRRVGAGIWSGALLALAGLYLLCVTETQTLRYGDALQLAGAVFWAVHMLILSRYAPSMPSSVLACAQFLICAAIALVFAALFEPLEWSRARSALPAVAYSGGVAVALGYTLQVVGQRVAIAAHAAIIMSTEAVFAAVFGWVLLDETLNARALAGCALLLAAVLVAQLWPLYATRRTP